MAKSSVSALRVSSFGSVAKCFVFLTPLEIKHPLWCTMLISILLGIAVHLVLDIPNHLNYYIGLSKKQLI